MSFGSSMGEYFLKCWTCNKTLTLEVGKEFNEQDIVCAKCKLPRTKDGHDPCIPDLPGVAFACCGHGNPNSAYIAFANGQTIRGGVFDQRPSLWTKKVCTEHLENAKTAIEARIAEGRVKDR